MSQSRKMKNHQIIEDIICIPDPSTGEIAKILVDEDQLENVKLIESNKDTDVFNVPGSSPGKIFQVVIDKKRLRKENVGEFVIFTTDWEPF